MEGMSTYTLNIPTEKVRQFRSLAKELGGTMTKQKAAPKETKRCGLDEALDDIKEGRIHHADSVEDLFKQILG